MTDDDLIAFEAKGPTPLPEDGKTGFVSNSGARIWFGLYGQGPVVVLLHGGLGNAGNWGYQVPALVATGYSVLVIDSRGHGRSTRDDQPYTYDLMADDVIAVMDHLEIAKAAFVGWSDGACISLVLADTVPERAFGVFFFGCNMDPSGTKEFVMTPEIEKCFSRHKKDYAALSATPERFDDFVGAVSLMMQTEPNYSADDLGKIKVPVTIVQSEFDEFIKPEHADYLYRSIPGAQFLLLPGVSHFAPVQRPDAFNAAVLRFLSEL